jgi:hypothetical protein
MYSLRADEWAELTGCGWLAVITSVPATLRDPHDLNGRMVRIDGGRYIVTSVETAKIAPTPEAPFPLPLMLMVLPAPRRPLRAILNWRSRRMEWAR